LARNADLSRQALATCSSAAIIATFLSFALYDATHALATRTSRLFIGAVDSAWSEPQTEFITYGGNASIAKALARSTKPWSAFTLATRMLRWALLFLVGRSILRTVMQMTCICTVVNSRLTHALLAYSIVAGLLQCLAVNLLFNCLSVLAASQRQYPFAPGSGRWAHIVHAG